jgi:hypothetical protein
MMRLEFDQYISPDGVIFDLNDWEETFILSGLGYGMPPIEFKTSRGPYQNGETPVDFVLRPRQIDFIVRISNCSREEYMARREKILDILRPSRQYSGHFDPGVLRKVLEDGTIRDLNVFAGAGPDFTSNNKDWDEWGSVTSIRFVAFDPVFFDPTRKQTNISPVAAVVNDDGIINYTGSWIEYPVIEIIGPIESPTITNQETGEFIEMTYDVPLNDTVTLDLTYGNKYVTDQHGANLIGTITSDSDLATFHLAPTPEAPGGVNTIHVDGTGATPGTTRIAIKYYLRYIGI